MSSVSTYTPNTVTIDYEAPNRFRVAQGADTIPAAAGQTGQVLDEKAVNKLLEKWGLKATSTGELVSLDGFSVDPKAVTPALRFGEPPELPDVTGPALAPAELKDKLAWASSAAGFAEVSTACLAWIAISELAYSTMRDLSDSKQLRNALQKQKIDLKDREITTNEERIGAERQAAWSSFAASVIGAVVTIGAGYAGATIGKADVGSPAAAMLSMAGYSLGNVVSSFERMASKNFGPQAVADQKQIEAMRWQREQEVTDQAVQEAESTYQESKELMKQAIKMLNDVSERQSQIVQGITRV